MSVHISGLATPADGFEYAVFADVRVGLTGGIGSGKSAVAQFFSRWGAVVIDADVLAREVTAAGMPALAQIAEIWPGVLSAEGSLDRSALASIVFSDAQALAGLTAIIHPRVRQRAAALEAAAPSGAIVVHVVPLLFEGDFWRTCDRTVLVTAPRTLRIERVVARDGLTARAVAARMAAQIDPERAAELADMLIENDGDTGVLEERARSVYEALQRQAAA